MPPPLDEQVEEIMRALKIGNPTAAEKFDEDDIKEWIREGNSLPQNMRRVGRKLKQYGS